jgi:uncharacterized protein YcaQ
MTSEIWIDIAPGRKDPTAGPDGATRLEIQDDLIGSGDLVPVVVDGVRGPRFVLREDLPLLEAAGRMTALPSPATATLLAPLDPLAWDRTLLRSLWGFDYRWEVYTPPAKRRYGYYVVPIVWGDRLVGRIEPRIDRASGTGRILGLWWEPGVDPGREAGLVEAVRDAIAAWMPFVGARRLAWGAGLAAERRRFGAIEPAWDAGPAPT